MSVQPRSGEATPLLAKATTPRTETGEVDFEYFVRSRPHLTSYPTPDWLGGFSGVASLAGTPAASAASAANTDDGQEEDPTDKTPDSKYVNISTGRFWLAYITIIVGYFVACFDTTLMASSHPVITSYFNASEAASWLTTVFMITNSAFNPLWGRLSDTIGRQSVYLLVLTIFALTNLWCGLAQSIGSVIAARAVCGLGAGGIMSIGLVIVNDLVRIEYRGVYISAVNVIFGLGSACGAAFGGLLCDKLGWRWAFGIQVPIIAVCGVAALFTVPKSLGPMLIKGQSAAESVPGQHPAWVALKNFDNLGVATLATAVTFDVLFLSLGGTVFPWKHPLIIVCGVLGAILSVAVVFVERRAKQPIMPIRLLYKPPVANLVAANFLGATASNTVLFNAPLWFQAVDLTSPTESGLRLAAPSVGSAIAGLATGYVITYTRRMKPLLVLGAVVYVGGSIALCLIQRSFSAVESIIAVTPTPLGQGFIYPGSMMAAFAVSDMAEQAVVTTTLQLWRNLGIVVGVAVSSLVFQNMLNINLEKRVRGPDAAEVIHEARSKVRAIKHLPELYREPVIESYAVALKLSFITALVASALMLILIVPVKLPRLSRRKNMAVATE